MSVQRPRLPAHPRSAPGAERSSGRGCGGAPRGPTRALSEAERHRAEKTTVPGAPPCPEGAAPRALSLPEPAESSGAAELPCARTTASLGSSTRAGPASSTCRAPGGGHGQCPLLPCLPFAPCLPSLLFPSILFSSCSPRVLDPALASGSGCEHRARSKWVYGKVSLKLGRVQPPLCSLGFCLGSQMFISVALFR